MGIPTVIQVAVAPAPINNAPTDATTNPAKRDANTEDRGSEDRSSTSGVCHRTFDPQSTDAIA
jgi:hypothetical protein